MPRKSVGKWDKLQALVYGGNKTYMENIGHSKPRKQARSQG